MNFESLALAVLLLLVLQAQFGIWKIEALLVEDVCDCDPDCIHCHPAGDEVLS